MAILLKDYLVDRLPPYIIDNDSYKDGNQQGFVERFVEIFGAELDDYYYNEISGIVDLIDPASAPASYLDYIAYSLGDLPNISTSDAHYRNILSFIISIYKIKGTAQSYKSIMTTAKIYSTTVTEVPLADITYDNGGTYYYDDGISYYDANCAVCSDYSLTLLGTESMDAILYQKIRTLITLVEPINATLTTITYNGQLVTEVLIDVWVDSNGDLIYNNDDDPGLTLSLDEYGNLVIEGPNADLYFVNESGDLIYVKLT
jgi:phage tail-like protein